MTDLTTEAFEAATERGKKRLSGPRAKSAHYDLERDRIVIRLETGVEICFAPQAAQELQNASAKDLDVIEIEAFGLGIHFPRLDADLYLPSLVRGIAGSKRWTTARLRPADIQPAKPVGTAPRERRRRAPRPRKATSPV